MIEKIAKELGTPKAGVSPNYSEFHVVMAFFILGGGPMGRKALARRLDVGEGTARTLIEKLRDRGLLSASPTGYCLTEGGGKVLADFKKRVSYHPNVGGGCITLGRANSAILIRGAAKLVRSGIEQRDAAISVGTVGATTIVFDEDGLKVPTIDDDEDMRIRMKVLCEDMEMERGDVLVIGTGETGEGAERAAWAAAYTVLERVYEFKGG